MLREANIAHDDVSYGGTSDSIVSLDYFREKAREFQVTLTNIDQGLRAAMIARAANISPEFNAEMDRYIAEINGKKFTLRSTAEAINAGAALINAAGGRFPQLSIPVGLGAFPIVLSAAAIAAIGVASGLIVWGSQLISGLNERLAWAAQVQGLTETQRADLVEAKMKADAASGGLLGFTGGASLLKWGAIIALGYLAWRAMNDAKGRR